MHAGVLNTVCVSIVCYYELCEIAIYISPLYYYELHYIN